MQVGAWFQPNFVTRGGTESGSMINGPMMIVNHHESWLYRTDAKRPRSLHRSGRYSKPGGVCPPEDSRRDEKARQNDDDLIWYHFGERDQRTNGEIQIKELHRRSIDRRTIVDVAILLGSYFSNVSMGYLTVHHTACRRLSSTPHRSESDFIDLMSPSPLLIFDLFAVSRSQTMSSSSQLVVQGGVKCNVARLSGGCG
jgi:hypothetical protein